MAGGRYPASPQHGPSISAPARHFVGSVFEVEHGERQAERIENTHAIVFAHPRFAEGREARGKLWETADYRLGDLVFGARPDLAKSVAQF